MTDIDEWLSPRRQAEASDKARSLRNQATKGLRGHFYINTR